MADSTISQFVSSGTTAERTAYTPDPPTPAAGPDPGYVWWDTDTQTEWAYDFGLADWVELGSGSGGGGMGIPILGTFTVPVDGDFAWINQNSATATQVGDGIVLTGAAAGSGDFEWALRVQSAPSTPYTITVYIVPSPFFENFRFDALVFRQSSDGKFAAFGNHWNTFASSPMVQVTNFSSVTAQNAALSSNNWQFQSKPYWLQISDDGSDRFYRISSNGVTWLQIYTEGRTTYFTADQVGFGINRRSGGTSILTLLSWAET